MLASLFPFGFLSHTQLCLGISPDRTRRSTGHARDLTKVGCVRARCPTTLYYRFSPLPKEKTMCCFSHKPGLSAPCEGSDKLIIYCLHTHSHTILTYYICIFKIQIVLLVTNFSLRGRGLCSGAISDSMFKSDP